jgi:thiamine biosynthesis lipoprotein
MKRFILLILLSLQCLSADTIRREQVVMGTYAFVIVEQEDAKIADAIFRRMKEVETSLSSFLEEGGVSKLNHQRKGRVDDDLLEALKVCERLYRETDGYFDCTIGSVTKEQFGFGTQRERIPSATSLAESKVGMDGLHRQGRDVWLEEGIYLDLGGMGKGFGVDKAADIMRRAGMTKGIIGLSGDIRCFGPCHIAIQNPFGDGTIGTIDTMREESGITTSGIYRRFVKTESYHHLIDPKRKQSEKVFASVTLVAPLPNVWLDGWATAIAVMPPSLALKFLNAHPLVAYLLIGTNGVVLKRGDAIRYTAHNHHGFILHPSLSLKEKSKWLQK